VQLAGAQLPVGQCTSGFLWRHEAERDGTSAEMESRGCVAHASLLRCTVDCVGRVATRNQTGEDRGSQRGRHFARRNHIPGARFTKYLTTVLRLSYDNAKVTTDLRRTSSLYFFYSAFRQKKIHTCKHTTRKIEKKHKILIKHLTKNARLFWDTIHLHYRKIVFVN